MRQQADRLLLVQPLPHPLEQRPEPYSLPLFEHGRADELRLPAFAMRRKHQTARHTVCGFCAKITAHDVQAEINAGRTARGRQDTALVHVENVRIEGDLRIARCERRDIAPMRRGTPAAQKTGSGKHGNAGAERHDTGTALMSLTQRINQRLRHRRIDRPPARHDDEIGFGQNLQAPIDRNAQSARSTERPRFDAADRIMIPALAHFRTWKTKTS
ncbi:hypothetical protein AJ87_21995 [Rhizobium yanglingense]|nr:hypothetical protein AJ87_21995 [Rhizobium yanglingense]